MAKIVASFPPNIDAIRAKFTLSGNEIFAWEGTIYNPKGGDLPPWLVAHEEVHFKQQADVGGAESWWARYLVDPQFRFEQELEAHQEEYRVYGTHNPERNLRRAALKHMARRLASPMYGSMVTFDKAKRLLK